MRYLEGVIAALDSPNESSNLADSNIAGLKNYALVHRQIPTVKGMHDLKIGIVSDLPLETAR
jgi:hypothetical protein